MNAATAPVEALRVHSLLSPRPGPALAVLGGVHGDEICGTEAIARVLARFDGGDLALVRGRCTFVPIANPLARRLQRRGGERNLNRSFRPSAVPADYEAAVTNQLCPLLAAHDVLLDLHSFESAGQAFAMVGPRDNTGMPEPFARAAEEGWLARHMGTDIVVEGWLDIYAASLARRGIAPEGDALAFGEGTNEWMRRQGGYAVTLECGQHLDPGAPQRAEQAVLNVLALLGLIDRPAPALPPAPRVLRMAGVVDREGEGDRLLRPWATFDRIARGEPLARRADGSLLRAENDGVIVFPNHKAEIGAEWFYWAVESDRALNPPLP